GPRLRAVARGAGDLRRLGAAGARGVGPTLADARRRAAAPRERPGGHRLHLAPAHHGGRPPDLQRGVLRLGGRHRGGARHRLCAGARGLRALTARGRGRRAPGRAAPAVDLRRGRLPADGRDAGAVATGGEPAGRAGGRRL
ncbi:MAG: transmembrane transport protein, partial [uncultured Corynebacteriales bacterium]